MMEIQSAIAPFSQKSTSSIACPIAGDAEKPTARACGLAGWLPVAALGAALKLIPVSKLKPGNENFARHGTASAP